MIQITAQMRALVAIEPVIGFTRRHIGGARTRARSPAAINNCAS
jgi:hypothetical protein